MLIGYWTSFFNLVNSPSNKDKQLPASEQQTATAPPVPHPTHRSPPRNHDPNAHQSKAAHVHHSSSHMQHVSSTGAVSSTNEGSI